MLEAVFDAERSCNSKDSIQFVRATLGALLIGNHKRYLCYTLIFGDGPITARKVPLVSEGGCREVYETLLQPSDADKFGVRQVDACLYRESC